MESLSGFWSRLIFLDSIERDAWWENSSLLLSASAQLGPSLPMSSYVFLCLFYCFLLIVLRKPRFPSLCSFQWDHWGSSVAGRHSGLLWPALARSCHRVYPGIPQIQWISTPVNLLNNIVAYCEHLWTIFSFIHHIQLIWRFHCDFQEGYLSVAAFRCI